nr:Chain C, Non-structural protein 1 [H5N1 subtype]7QTO_D Chain D, Non-structural protein 1 [H5N1 subtype]
ARTIESEV